ncbi:MAG: hypothetical protein KIT79_06145 [Deltaproteobacteria bacterium]|nr:hypothetical protein [Deltaproteobacteria bacterium]
MAEKLSPSLREALVRLLECPTTTTFERYSHAAALSLLKSRRIPCKLDRYGNIHAGDLKSKSPLIFVAHLDHPGFSLAPALGGPVETLTWWGRVDPKLFSRARVRLYPYDCTNPADASKQAIEGTIRSMVMNPQAMKPKTVKVRLDEPAERGRTYVGNWALAECRIAGKWIESIRIDDLVGSACIIELLTRLKGTAHIRAFLTRGEENGFYGALAGAKLVPERSLLVSVETSSERPGAVPGGGPIVRLGDATCVFDPMATRLLTETALALQKENPRFRFQKRVMDGGTCEATAFLALGLRATGLAVSLVNYHNQGKGKLESERVTASDTEGLLRLMESFARRYRPGRIENDLSRRLQKRVTEVARILEARPLA